MLADDQPRDDGSITLHAEADFAGIAQAGALEAGVFVSFLAFELDETGFESLAFRIDNGAQAVLERIFEDSASALAFFTGPALELENVAGMTTVAGQFDLRFHRDLVSSLEEDRVGALFALGTAPVPEPGTGMLIAFGLIAIAARRRRTR